MRIFTHGFIDSASHITHVMHNLLLTKEWTIVVLPVLVSWQLPNLLQPVSVYLCYNFGLLTNSESFGRTRFLLHPWRIGREVTFMSKWHQLDTKSHGDHSDDNTTPIRWLVLHIRQIWTNEQTFGLWNQFKSARVTVTPQQKFREDFVSPGTKETDFIIVFTKFNVLFCSVRRISFPF